MERDREAVSPRGAGQPLAHYSPAIIHDGTIFCSGVLGIDPVTGELAPGGVREQTIRAIRNLAVVLEEAGSGLDRLLKVTCYLEHREDFEEFNRTYAELIPAPPPARATVSVRLVVPDSRIEIEAIAATGQLALR